MLGVTTEYFTNHYICEQLTQRSQAVRGLRGMLHLEQRRLAARWDEAITKLSEKI